MRSLIKTEVVGPAEPRVELMSMYMETLQLVERLHRRLHDVVKDEFDRIGRTDINAVQGLLLFNIGDAVLTASELRTRGSYLGSNASYNLKKLVDLSFIDQRRSSVDRRAVEVQLTPAGADIAAMVAELYDRHIASIDKVGGLDEQEFQKLNKAMQRLDRFWNDQIQYRL